MTGQVDADSVEKTLIGSITLMRMHRELVKFAETADSEEILDAYNYVLKALDPEERRKHKLMIEARRQAGIKGQLVKKAKRLELSKKEER